MKTPVIYRADYTNHAGQACRVHVRVLATIAEDGSGREVFYAYHPLKLGCGKNASTPDAAVLHLINDHGRTTSCQRMPPTLADLKADISAAYQESLRDARRTARKGFYRSRGRWVVITGHEDAIIPIGEWEWTGTAKQLREIMQYALNPDTVGIHIDGGVDFAEALRDFADGCYEPLVTEWSVCLYHNNVETLKEGE